MYTLCRKITLILAIILPLFICGQNFQMTIKPGTLANAVKATVRPGLPIDGRFSSAQICFIVSTSVGARPAISIVQNFISGMNYSIFESVETLSDDTYYVWLFDGIGSAAVPLLNFASGVEVDMLEVKFTGGFIAPFQVRVAQLPNGGVGGQAPGNYNFYLALSGTDVVNQSAQFYGQVYSNSGLGYAGYSYAALNGIALPVKFLSFSADQYFENAKLSWKVAGETNLTQYYDVERSINGIDFVSIGIRQAEHNGQPESLYLFTDFDFKAVDAPVVYYRIRQVDQDGSCRFSSIENIRKSIDVQSISIYPNPVVNEVTINFHLKEKGRVHYTITDAKGRLVHRFEREGRPGTNNLSIPFSHLAKGTYYLKLECSEFIQNIPIVKM